MNTVPFTERSNVITQEIDVGSPSDMVDLLGRTDADIFSGAGLTSENLLSEKVVQSITNLVDVVRNALKGGPDDVVIILGGCGTSGRLGYLISKVFNELANKLGLGNPFSYSIAGGDKSLLTSQEAPEDDPNEGVTSLIKICANKKKVIYIGITCGISAPFVGGQLDWCMRNLNTSVPVLLGFNRLDMARNIKIHGWNRTMLDVAREMESLSGQKKAIVINPILGAEAITGSSRMKGGSATKVILETAFLLALNSLETKCDSVLPTVVKEVLSSYKDICRDFYSSWKIRTVTSDLIQYGGSALKKNGAIHYLASGWKGVIPLIDSTECPPTFGSTVDDVRGFIQGGYDFLDIDDYGKKNASFKLGISDAVELYSKNGVPNAQVLLFVQGPSDPILKELEAGLGLVLKSMRGMERTVAVVLSTDRDEFADNEHLDLVFDKVVHVEYPSIATTFQDWGNHCAEAARDSLHGMCLKWLVNAISTCSHVLLGKVYKNYMCDVKVSNNKLYHRAIGIIQKLSGADYEAAREALLKSIYGIDEVGDEVKCLPVSQHYNVAAHMDQVVPLAILLAKQHCLIDEARSTLKRFPIIKNAVLAMNG